VTDRFGPEISDLIVDYDPDTLERRPVMKRAVLERLESEGRAAPLRVARALAAADDGVLDAKDVDGALLRSHLELQRLHEEFRVGALIRALLAPLVDLARRVTSDRPIRLVDIGCGLGVVARWLAAYGALGDEVQIVGADYNRTFVGAANALAEAEGLRCRFVAANAFRLSPPAHLYISTGVLHHFRGPDLERLFAEHERTGALGFVHVDIRPSLIAPIGSWIFHQARMREPLAKWDGYWSAVRAHDADTLVAAAKKGAPGFTTATVDAQTGLYAVVRIFQALVAVRAEHHDELERAYRSLGRRIRLEAR
jgi:SAM-dependent methyltransferase